MSAEHEKSPAHSPEGEARRRKQRENARAVLWVVIAVLATVFAVLNVGDVKVHWIIGSGNAPLIIVIVISLLAGVVLAALGQRLARRRRR